MILRRSVLLLLAATAAFVHAGRIAASNAATRNQTQLARSGAPVLGLAATSNNRTGTGNSRTTRALNQTLGAAAPPPNHWKAEAQRKANLRSRLQAKADGFQKEQKRSLAAISSDDVRREAEDASIEEQLLISQFISTPDLSLFGGVSGITYDDDGKEYLAVTNDVRYRPSLLDSLLGQRQGNATGNHTNAVVVPANETDPVGTPRWYTIDFKDGVANVTGVTYLRNPDTLHYFYQSGNVSVQAIAYCEDMIYVALDKGPTSPKGFRPLIVEYNRTGHVMGTFRYPDWFNFSSRGFTGLTINPNEHRLYAATGDALVGDGKGSIRITEFDLSTRESGRQYVYEADLEHVVGLVSIDENGGFLVLERSNVKAEYNPYIGNTATVPPVVGRSQPGSWYGYDVYLYYALCLDALNVQNVTTGLEGFRLNTMRKDLIQEWNNVTKFEAIGPAGSHSTYRRPTSPSKSAGKGKGRGPAAKKTHSDSSRRRRRHRGLSAAKETSEHNHRHLKDDSIDMILVADNEFVRDTEVQFLEVDIHEVPLLKAAEETEDLLSDGGGEEADTRAKDPAIWVHPSDPEHSLIIGAMAKGLVQVYDLEGTLKQTVNNGNEASGVDVMYSFKLADDNLVDIAIVSDRAGNRIEAYKITYEDSNNNNVLSGISEGLPSIGSPSGLATYTSPFTGKSFVFVLESDNQIKQVALKSTSDNQRVGGDIVRTISLPASAGGLVVDQELGYLYVSLKDDNDKGIIKYDAEVDEYRDNDNFPETIVDGDRSFFKGSDIEGITLYYGDQGDGYLVVSVAGDSTFAVFERESDNDYYDSFTIGHNDKDDIDRVDRTEGVAITNVYLGSEFKCGVFVASDIDNGEVLINEDNDGALVNGNTNFKLVPFEELAEKLYYYLDVDTDSWDPRRFALVIWINCIAQDMYSALNEGKLSGRDTEKLLFYLNEATRHTYPRASKKQQMISRLNPFEYDDRRRSLSLEDRRLESRRRYEQDQQQRSRELPSKKKKEQKRGDCRRRRRLGVDTGKARDDLDDFIDRLQTLRDAGRLNDVGDDRYNHWKDLANGVKDQLHDDR